MATPQASDRTESNWPGERIPSRDDVRDAIKVPDHTFLDRYKTTLLASSDALHPEDLMSDVEVRVSSIRHSNFTDDLYL
jgi:hypothetical protein